MPSTTGAKASQNITIRLLMASMRGNLFNVVDSSGTRDTKMFMVCPSCQNSRLHQVNCCDAGCRPDDKAPAEYPEGWKTGEIDIRGKTVNEELVVMTDEEIAEAKASGLSKGVLDLAIHPADQVAATTVATGTVYYFDPDESNSFFTLLVEQMADRNVVLMGNLLMRSAVKLYRLDATPSGGLLLRELTRPEATHQFTAVAKPAPSEKEAKMFAALIETLVEDFDPELYASESIKNLRELIASKTGDAVIVPIKKGKQEPEDDLATALEASLAAAVAQKKSA